MVPTPHLPTIPTLRTTCLGDMMQFLLGLTLRWLVFPNKIGRLPINTRVPPNLTPWKLIPIGTILAAPSLPPKAVTSAQRIGALVAYPLGPSTVTLAEIPFEFPIDEAVILPLVPLNSPRLIALSFPRPREIPKALLPHRVLKLGAMWTLRTHPGAWVQRQ